MIKQKVAVGIGSNLDNPEANVRSAVQAIAELKVGDFRCSSLYESAPMGPQDQPDYINAVVTFETELPATKLLDELQMIEAQHGRVRDGERWGPRTLDLDLLLYGADNIESDRLVVPHPGIADREFVLIPLAEIEPEMEVPAMGSVAELAKRFAGHSMRKLQSDTASSGLATGE